MKKTLIATATATALLLATGTASASSFIMLDALGGGVGNDQTTSDVRNFGAGTWALSSNQAFFGQNWTAHTGTVYSAPGTYTFDTIQGATYKVELTSGFTMGHILFNWGVTSDIDVINIWDAAGNSIDGNGDGVSGVGMIDGAFVGFNANFNAGTANGTGGPFTGDVSVIPVPAAVWLFGSGLLGLVGVARRKAVA